MIEEVEKIVKPVYMVGGSVRDELLGLTPKDYDFSTPLVPDEIEKMIRNAGRKPYLVGKKFGTVGVRINGNLIEITTFRNEKYQEGSRKPDVSFVKDITADLSRRDFTINAIAKRKGKYIDPFNGQIDLKNKIIRCVGKPIDRFREDPLRMLRAARFASQLKFNVDGEIIGMMRKKAHRILHVSKERWVMELDKILMTNEPSIGLCILAYTDVLKFMMSELSLQIGYNQNSKYHSLKLWDHTMMVVDGVSDDINLRWAALLHDIGKPYVRSENANTGYSNYIKHDFLGKEIVLKIAGYLKWSNERRDKVSDLVLNHLEINSPLRIADNEAKII